MKVIILMLAAITISGCQGSLASLVGEAPEVPDGMPIVEQAEEPLK